MNSSSPAWSLHPQLERDTALVSDLPLSRLLAMNDANYPWLVLVPRRANVVELIDLDDTGRNQLTEEVVRTSRALKDTAQCDKLNVAALGNVVPQLHVHVIARRRTDAAWPKPVWGVVSALPYDAAALTRFVRFDPGSPMNQMNDVAFDLGPKPDLAYGGSAIDRAAERRGNAAFLDEIERADNCVTYAVSGELVILRKDEAGFSPAYTAAAAAALGRIDQKIFLGMRGACGCFGVGIDPGSAERLRADDNFFLTDLRSVAIQGLVSFEHLPPLAEAKSLLHWHARHRYCANCGATTQAIDGGWRRDCPQCQAQHFPRTDPVAIMLAVDGDRCLLGRQSRFAPGMWSCLAGFAEPGESIEETVRRETLEEAGIRCGRVRYFASQPWPFPSSLMIGCHTQALSHNIRVDRNELEDARWFSRRDAALMLTRTHPDGLSTPPPFAIAHHIIRDWVEHGDAVFA